jgi:hypothetical protein
MRFDDHQSNITITITWNGWIYNCALIVTTLMINGGVYPTCHMMMECYHLLIIIRLLHCLVEELCLL